MKKSEKIISALLTMALGVMFVILKDNFIGILMTVAGVSLLILGVVDIINRGIPPAIIKIVSGLLLIICGWAIVEAVLYVLSGILLVFGILLLYGKIKNKPHCALWWHVVLEYATPIICISIGILLLFHKGDFIDAILVVSGILTIIEGSILLLDPFLNE